MPSTTVLCVRIDPRRKARVEKILDQLGITPMQAVNMFYAEIERRKAIPFPVAIEGNDDVVPPIEHVAQVWSELDQEDFRAGLCAPKEDKDALSRRRPNARGKLEALLINRVESLDRGESINDDEARRRVQSCIKARKATLGAKK